MQIDKGLEYLPEYLPFDSTLLSFVILFQELLQVQSITILHLNE